MLLQAPDHERGQPVQDAAHREGEVSHPRVLHQHGQPQGHVLQGAVAAPLEERDGLAVARQVVNKKKISRHLNEKLRKNDREIVCRLKILICI